MPARRRRCAGACAIRPRPRPTPAPAAPKSPSCRSDRGPRESCIKSRRPIHFRPLRVVARNAMASHLRRITRALLSVSDKNGLTEFARQLASHGIEFISTGGTAKALQDAGLKVIDVSMLTGFPEMMDGRVKTLHPKVHGGLLGIRDNKDHAGAMEQHGIKPIDLLVVNLYPFEATVAKGA